MEKINNTCLKNFSSLVCGDYYFVSQCRKCKRIKFNYNNILLEMTTDGYKMFLESLDSIYEKSRKTKIDRNSLIFIKYGDQKDLRLVFDFEEFNHVRKIIHESILMLQVNSLLDQEKQSEHQMNQGENRN